ncbi:MAG: AEC family transporter [Clostridiaceae bacterium]|nr:AEC family transporter [Clostridiaceae bacterium]
MTIASISISDIITQTLILFFLIGLGYLFAKTKYLPEFSGVVLSKLVIKVAMPATILVKILGADFTREDYINGIYIYVFAILFLLLTLAISLFASRVMKLPDKTEGVYAIQAMFGNVAFFALPLFLVLFGEEGVIYAMFFNMGNDTLLWSIGVFLVNRHKERDVKKNLKHMINANTIAFVLGILLMVTGINKVLLDSKYFFSIYTTMDYVAGITTPLSMIFIGFILAGIKLRVREFRKKVPILVLSIQRLLLVPILSMALFYLLYGFGLIKESVVLITVLQLAMPIGTLTASLAMEYESDYFFATEAVFVSTLLSILTLPLISVLLKVIF